MNLTGLLAFELHFKPVVDASVAAECRQLDRRVRDQVIARQVLVQDRDM